MGLLIFSFWSVTQQAFFLFRFISSPGPDAIGVKKGNLTIEAEERRTCDSFRGGDDVRDSVLLSPFLYVPKGGLVCRCCRGRTQVCKSVQLCGAPEAVRNVCQAQSVQEGVEVGVTDP